MRRGLAAAFFALLAGPALACQAPPHSLSQMPETYREAEAPVGLRAVWFDAPTRDYPHGVLGDTIEARALWAYSASASTPCAALGVVLDDAHVFEDIAPRLADLDGDGRAEIIVVRSSLTQGAQLAIYGEAEGGEALRLIAATPYIGRANRWLAPIGAGDLDGDGAVEIAYIDRPHLVRTLRIWRFEDGALRELASAGGLTNHRIGEAFITGGLRDCGQGLEMITANRGWSRVMASRFDGAQVTTRALTPFSAATVAAALMCAF